MFKACSQHHSQLLWERRQALKDNTSTETSGCGGQRQQRRDQKWILRMSATVSFMFPPEYVVFISLKRYTPDLQWQLE